MDLGAGMCVAAGARAEAATALPRRVHSILHPFWLFLQPGVAYNARVRLRLKEHVSKGHHEPGSPGSSV